MERIASINKILETMNHSIVKKYTQLPIISYVLIATGIFILYIVPHLVNAQKSIVESLFILVSIALILWGFLSIVDEKHYFKHIKSGLKIYFYEIYFERSDFQLLFKIIETGNFSDFYLLQKSSSHSVKLRIAYTANKSFCIIQGVKYIPFEFAELTIAKELDSQQIDKLFDLIGFTEMETQKHHPELI